MRSRSVENDVGYTVSSTLLVENSRDILFSSISYPQTHQNIPGFSDQLSIVRLTETENSRLGDLGRKGATGRRSAINKGVMGRRGSGGRSMRAGDVGETGKHHYKSVYFRVAWLPTSTITVLVVVPAAAAAAPVDAVEV